MSKDYSMWIENNEILLKIGDVPVLKVPTKIPFDKFISEKIEHFKPEKDIPTSGDDPWAMEYANELIEFLNNENAKDIKNIEITGVYGYYSCNQCRHHTDNGWAASDWCGYFKKPDEKPDECPFFEEIDKTYYEISYIGEYSSLDELTKQVNKRLKQYMDDYIETLAISTDSGIKYTAVLRKKLEINIHTEYLIKDNKRPCKNLPHLNHSPLDDTEDIYVIPDPD